MQDELKVEIVPRTVTADDDTVAQRADTVHRLADLGQIDNVEAGELGATTTDGWLARVGGIEFPVVAYAVEQAEDSGAPLVSLVLAPACISVDSRPGTDPGPAAAAATLVKPTISYWGAPGTPDPREAIPGWAPEPSLGEQVAVNAGLQAFAEEPVRSTMQRLGLSAQGGFAEAPE